MSRSVTDPRLCFVVDFEDKLAGIVRKYQMLFFLSDSTVELTDIRNRRIFLKRTHCPTLAKDMLFLGASIVVYGRVYIVTEYGDEVTRQLCESLSEPTLLVLSSKAFDSLGELLTTVQLENGFTIRDMSSTVVKPSELETAGVAPLSSPVLVLDVVRQHAAEKAVHLMKLYPANVLWASTNKEQYEKALPLLEKARKCPSYIETEDTSLCLVKPHATRDFGGEIVDALTRGTGLKIAAIAQFHLTSNESSDFLEPYKCVLKDYTDVVSHLSSSLTWGIQVVGQDAASKLREVCGPFDPFIAKKLRPKTIRARFGVDRVQNAVHCTDLPDCGLADVEFFFVSIVAAHYGS